jgi:hypothetical protein
MARKQQATSNKQQATRSRNAEGAKSEGTWDLKRGRAAEAACSMQHGIAVPHNAQLGAWGWVTNRNRKPTAADKALWRGGGGGGKGEMLFALLK